MEYQGKIYNEKSFLQYNLTYKYENGTLYVRPTNKVRFYKINSPTGIKIINTATNNHPEYLLNEERQYLRLNLENDWEQQLINLDRKLPPAERPHKTNNLKYIVAYQYINEDLDIKAGTNCIGKTFKNIETLIRYIKRQSAFYTANIGSILQIWISTLNPRNRPVIPMGEGTLNCILEGVLKEFKNPNGRKRKTDQSIIKQLTPIPKYGAEEFIQRLETLIGCSIYVFDRMGYLWRTSTKKSKIKIIFRCDDYHATLITGEERNVSLEKIKSAELHYNLDDVPEPKEHAITNFAYTHIKPIAPNPNRNEWVSHEELQRLGSEFEITNRKHFPIMIANGDCLGIMDKVNKINYKSKHFFKNACFVDESTTAWSLASLIKQWFQQYLRSTYTGEELTQITQPTILKHVKSGQIPFHYIYQHESKGSIHQIDMKRAYTNSSIGNMGEMKKYYNNYPTAPRNILNMNKPLTETIYTKIKKFSGYAVFNYDQTHLKVPTFFNGPTLSGTCCQPIPAMLYMYDQGVKIHIRRIYFSLTNFNPFIGFHKILESKKEDWTLADPSGDLCDEYYILDKGMNLLIGALNKKIHKTQTVSTISKQYNERIHYLMDKQNMRITHISRADYDKSTLQDPAIKDDLLPERITYKYTNDNELQTSVFQMSHLSGFVLAYQKIVLHNMMVKLTNSGRTLLYSNTDSIAFEGKPITDSLFHEEYSHCDEFLAPQINKTCFIRNNEIIGQRHSGLQRDLTIDEFRKIPARTYNDNFEFNDTEIPNYFTADENKPMENQELIFIHGKAGTGKSEIIKYLTNNKFNYTNTHNFKPMITLSTAMTHAARQIIKSDYTFKKILSSLKYGHKIPIPQGDEATKYRLTIDEVSMMTSKNLDSLNYMLIKYTGINRPFGGVSIVLFGHLAQLPSPDPDSTPFHTSKLFKLFNQINLTKNFRQSKDALFQSILNKIEDYYKVGGNRESNHYAKAVLPKILTAHELDQLNGRLSTHPDKPTKYKILQHSNQRVEESNSLLLNRPLTTGDEVVLRLNIKNMYNGNKYIIQSADDTTITINNKSFDRKHTKTQQGEKHANIQPTFASTIHCAQGQTHPVWINTDCINMGLLYVALSRAESLDDVQISKQF